VNINNSENLNNELTEQTIPTAATQKRSYKKREPNALTIASMNEKIKEREYKMEALQEEIEDLTAKRNELFFSESEMMGLINLMADPEKAAWLAKVVEESNKIRNQ